MYPRILKLSVSGSPLAWIPVTEAAVDMMAGRIQYGFGETVRLNGGVNRAGDRSFLEIPSIILARAGAGRVVTPMLNRRTLFARDQCTCMYCGDPFPEADLTIDHVLPRSRGGPHAWTNVVTACFKCNNRKDCLTPEEARMPLLSVPYTPNPYEYLYLRNRRVLADQMAFLSKGFKQLQLDS